MKNSEKSVIYIWQVANEETFTYKAVKNANQSQKYCKYFEIPLFGSFYPAESDSTDLPSTN